MSILQRYGFAMNRTMVNEDEPDHMERRRLLMDAFLPERLITLEPMVRNLARQYMDRFVNQGRADLVAEMFYEIPLNIALKFLGVPDEGPSSCGSLPWRTRSIPGAGPRRRSNWRLPKTWAASADRAADSGHHARPARRRGLDVRNHPPAPVAPRRGARVVPALDDDGHPGGGARNHLQRHGQRLPHAAVAPQGVEDICANPALIPNAVEECLRVAGSIIAWRRQATADAVVGGVPSPGQQAAAGAGLGQLRPAPF